MLHLESAMAFYRKASAKGAKVEDRAFINPDVNIFGLTDGNSAAFSPENPPALYGHMTGAQMVNWQVARAMTIISAAPGKCGVEEFLLRANKDILTCHRTIQGKDPASGDDVGGACFAFCQPQEDGLHLLLGGDAWIWIQTRKGPQFLTGFSQAAFDVEREHQVLFDRYKAQVNGDLGEAWNLYFGSYRSKRINCKNRNMDDGGDASLNGDPALEDCWKNVFIPWEVSPNMVLMGTDGMLPGSEVYPKNFDSLARAISYAYLGGSVRSLLAWRDMIEKSNPSTSHLKGQPEATAIELKFVQ